ncbi:transposase [Cellulosilyticum sp. I15G10I2]|uniref:transposase n=1 Tax=Cellulosilyticum sp. I15G10I2 TaxID=1892843 RepID=UPI00085BFFF2|nr:transposase [Cellulosilyticum sp. I15G10I2]
MPRGPREKCEYSTYHIMVRGNNKQDIFEDEEDRIQYLKRLKRYKEKFKIEVYAYCLMTNHVHLLIYDNGQDISKVMKGLNLSYVRYFNKRYNRCGHLFQGRFNSVMVKRDSYFIEVSKYIHLNPAEAGMVGAPEDYKWSSLKMYLGERDSYEIIDNRRILAYFSKDYKGSMKLYAEYMYNKEIEEEVAVAIESGHKGIRAEVAATGASKEMNEDQILAVVSKHFNVHKLQLLKRNNKIHQKQRDLSIYIMALIGKMTYKQLAEIFYVKPPAIGESIKRAINLMIEDQSIQEEVNKVLKQIA